MHLIVLYMTEICLVGLFSLRLHNLGPRATPRRPDEDECDHGFALETFAHMEAMAHDDATLPHVTMGIDQPNLGKLLADCASEHRRPPPTWPHKTMVLVDAGQATERYTFNFSLALP